jgi:uncharacterized protein (TIGR02246 family)
MQDEAGAMRDTAADAAALAGLVRAAAESWDRGDGAGYGRLFTADSDYVAFDGTHLCGREANARHHQRLFDTVLRESRLVFEEVPEVRFLTPDVAVLHTIGSVVMPWQRRVAARRRSNQTMVAVREKDGCWRVAAFHNTRCRPMRLPEGAGLRVILCVMRLRMRVAAWLGAGG